MIISIAQTARKLKIALPDLLTRPVGRRMYREISTMLVNAGAGEVVVFDFSSIRVIDSSFIDELIVRLLNEAHDGKRDLYFRVKNVTPSAEINIDSVFKNYSKYNNKKMVVITEDICKDNKFFIGPLGDMEKTVIDYLRINHISDIAELARLTGLDKEHLGVLMEDLYKLRLVRRMEQDRFSSV